MPRTRQVTFSPLNFREHLLNSTRQRKFNVPVTSLLLRNAIIPFPEQDAQLAKLIVRDMKPSVINFTVNLIRDCLLGTTPYATRDQFRHSLDALSQAVQNRKGTEV
jgi:CCR4-NOT transcription complex subunit 1